MNSANNASSDDKGLFKIKLFVFFWGVFTMPFLMNNASKSDLKDMVLASLVSFFILMKVNKYIHNLNYTEIVEMGIYVCSSIVATIFFSYIFSLSFFSVMGGLIWSFICVFALREN